MNRDLRAHAARLRVTARRLVGREGGGPLVSRHRGLGCEFLELRDYALGDDVRRIDWKGSARVGKTLVREYHEETRRTIYLMYDCSSSMDTIMHAARSCALLLLYAAEYVSDRIGLIQFDEDVRYIEPSHSKSIIRRIERELCANLRDNNRKTAIARAIEKLSSIEKNRSLICVISDGIDPQCAESLVHSAMRHDIIFFRVEDLDGKLLESALYSDYEEPESKKIYTNQQNFSQGSELFFKKQQVMLTKVGVDVCPVSADYRAYESVVRFFMKRRNR